jgi:hypothetical protein
MEGFFVALLQWRGDVLLAIMAVDRFLVDQRESSLRSRQWYKNERTN